jgi:hypothetical protein
MSECGWVQTCDAPEDDHRHSEPADMHPGLYNHPFIRSANRPAARVAVDKVTCSCGCHFLPAPRPPEPDRTAALVEFTGQGSWPCVCGHVKSSHYFGDALGEDGRMHTWCQMNRGHCTDFIAALGLHPGRSTVTDDLTDLDAALATAPPATETATSTATVRKCRRHQWVNEWDHPAARGVWWPVCIRCGKAHDPVPEARVAEGLTVEALATALVAVTPTKKHGQLCPVWTRRLESKSDSPHAKRARGGPVVCDCFVARDAPMKAAAILAALPAPRPPEPDRTALVCSGCRQDVDPTKGMLVHCDACTAAALQRTLDAKAEPPAPRPPEPDRTAALVGPVTVAVVDALMAEEIGAGHYRWQVMNIVRPAIVAALAPTPDEAP